MLDQGRGVDVLIHEMLVPPDLSAAKISGLNPEDPGWDQAVQVATAVPQSSHTPQLALGYILSQTQPRLGIATHFQVNDDTVGPAVADVQSWYGGSFAITTDLLVATVSRDDISLGQAVVSDFAWYPPRQWSTRPTNCPPPSTRPRPPDSTRPCSTTSFPTTLS